MAPSKSTRKVLEDFIKIYKAHPCLWQIKNKQYRDRDQKEAAYKLLIKKLKEIEPDADKAVVVRKINNLRSNVRKEKKKYKQSLKSPDGLYSIKLWYYDLFNFLDEQWSRRESSSNVDDDDDADDDDDDENSSERNNTEDSSTADQHFSSNSVSTPSTSSNDNNSSSRPPKPFTPKGKDESIADEVLESERDHFKRPRPISTEDRCDFIGKNVAMKLRALNTGQILVAEKLINDLLFEAEIGHLTSEHAYISMRDILKQNHQSHVPVQQYRQEYKTSPTSERTNTPVSFASSRSPSPPCLSFSTS